MAKNATPVLLNLGCGTVKEPGFVNVDAFSACSPDVIQDLDKFPYPWADSSVDGVQMRHVLEHTKDWWAVYLECVRILKPGGYLRIHVPDESSSTALTYRDHLHVFSMNSFHGTEGTSDGSNAWAMEQDRVPMRLEFYAKVPYKEYNWMARWCPRVLHWCARHLRNFIWEQQFVFRKIGERHV